jgi:DNA-damage-inducible protein D
MSRKITKAITTPHLSPFEQIRRTNDAGNEYWSSRDFAKVLNYRDYRNFEQVIAKARTACFNSGHRIDDHFGDVTDMIEIGKGAKQNTKQIYLSREGGKA